MTTLEIAGQIVALLSLGYCIAGFASTRDDRLAVLVILRIHLARRFQGNVAVMLGMLTISGVAAALTLQNWIDLSLMMAMLLGTVGMFTLRGIPMRLFLADAGLAWMGNNIAIGSVGATLAEALIVCANAVTILRLRRMRRRNLSSSQRSFLPLVCVSFQHGPS